MVKDIFLVVAYDISSNRRRCKIAKVLEKYGTRVNYSVFECLLTIDDAETMKQEIAHQMKAGKDNVLVYILCKSCLNRSIIIKGKQKEDTIVKVL